ncbi:hypothetical protein SEMRO_2597_G332190.1 [Seminavis robusta]|uniref:Uncharacterized protein n=1 Tax=Seminavis robusta TaxID=568900 RepID=A0A9N8F0G8_9STRA|nr:hypothetical protein SEMRO_2597_G332190.1 [Seminavis robusta]|eukprot:Sro2597_g332190.1 n/a (121) ;mRNA; f:11697-12059
MADPKGNSTIHELLHLIPHDMATQNQDNYLNDKIQTLGTQLNPNEWSHADKLNEPTKLAAEFKSSKEHQRTPTEEETAEAFIPFSHEELLETLPSKQNGWVLKPKVLKHKPNELVANTLK